MRSNMVGSIVLEGDKNWNGVGHNAVVSFDGTEYLVIQMIKPS